MHTDFMGRQIMFCHEFCSTTNQIAGVDNCAIVRFLMACHIISLRVLFAATIKVTNEWTLLVVR